MCLFGEPNKSLLAPEFSLKDEDNPSFIKDEMRARMGHKCSHCSISVKRKEKIIIMRLLNTCSVPGYSFQHVIHIF